MAWNMTAMWKNGQLKASSNGIKEAAEAVQEAPTGVEAIPNWTRVLAAFPDFPLRLREAVRADSVENASSVHTNSKHISNV